MAWAPPLELNPEDLKHLLRYLLGASALWRKGAPRSPLSNGPRIAVIGVLEVLLSIHTPPLGVHEFLNIGRTWSNSATPFGPKVCLPLLFPTGQESPSSEWGKCSFHPPAAGGAGLRRRRRNIRKFSRRSAQMAANVFLTQSRWQPTFS